jgi:hypothetical protein
MRTTIIGDSQCQPENCTDFAHNSARSPERRVKFRVTIRFHPAVHFVHLPVTSLCFTLRGEMPRRKAIISGLGTHLEWGTRQRQ